MKRILALLLIFCMSASLCGCYDNREIDMTAYVIALGIDNAEEGYNYTFQISSPLAMGGGGQIAEMGNGDKNKRVENIVIGAKNLYEARNILNNFLSKRINLSHLKMIAVSSEAAEQGLEPHMGFLLREREVRPNTRMCVAQESAEDFLKGVNPALEANTAEYYDLVFENGAVFAPSKTLWEFVNELSSFASVLPMGRLSTYKSSEEFSGEDAPRRVSTSKAEFSGICLFKGDRAVGYLSPEKSEIFGLLTGDIKEAEISLLKDGEYHSVKVFPQSDGNFSVMGDDDGMTLKMRQSFDAEVNSSGAVIKETEIEDYLQKEAYAVFLEIQDKGCDVFGAGNYFKRRCKTVSEWESIDWNEKFKSVYFLPEIGVNLTKTELGTA